LSLRGALPTKQSGWIATARFAHLAMTNPNTQTAATVFSLTVLQNGLKPCLRTLRISVMKKIYPSAVDAWLAILLIALPVSFVVIGLMRFEVESQTATVLIIQGAVVAVLIGVFCVPCRYTLTDDTLAIRCGVLTTTIPLAEVRGAELSSNVLSAPAMSLKRVKVIHGNDYALVSPRDREAFIKELMAAVERKKAG
jgi:hypothetical protein